MSLQGNFGKARQTPLMLTDGSSAPGAASAKARALSSGKIIKQTAGGHMEVRHAWSSFPDVNPTYKNVKFYRSWGSRYSGAR